MPSLGLFSGRTLPPTDLRHHPKQRLNLLEGKGTKNTDQELYDRRLCGRTAAETVVEGQFRHEDGEEGDYAGISEKLKKGH